MVLGIRSLSRIQERHWTERVFDGSSVAVYTFRQPAGMGNREKAVEIITSQSSQMFASQPVHGEPMVREMRKR